MSGARLALTAERRNALNQPMLAEFAAAVREVESDPAAQLLQPAETGPLETVLEFESWAQAASASVPTFRQDLARSQRNHAKR